MHCASPVRFIDLFAGIGGLRTPFTELGYACVFSSEIDRFARTTYSQNFHEIPHGDITLIDKTEIPDHDLLLAGFPCQTFSRAGLQAGFNDTRGTMFFEIYKTLQAKNPCAFLLENVKNLERHDGGSTFSIIKNMLMSEPLSYQITYKVLNASHFGLPQNRQRIFIVGIKSECLGTTGISRVFDWPDPPMTPTQLSDILEPNGTVDGKYTISDKLLKGFTNRATGASMRGSGFSHAIFTRDAPRVSTLLARYYKDGKEILVDQSDIGKNPRKLTPRECARLQGFDDEFSFNTVSNTQAYKQFGNSVPVPVVRAVARQLHQALTILTL